MLMSQKGYRTYFRELLASRCAQNPAYSLRAFAKNLDIAPSFLSALMNGKKSLSQEKALSLTYKLGLEGRERDFFLKLVEYESHDNPVLKDRISQDLQSLNFQWESQDLSLEFFKIISDWPHVAILEALNLSDFQSTPAELAELLGISIFEVNSFIDRLKRCELIEETEEGTFRKTRSNNRVESSIPNAALRNFHRQMLQKALESLERQSPQEKIVASETFAVDVDKLTELNDLTEEYLTKVNRLVQRSKKKNAVYHLGVQCFRLAKIAQSKTISGRNDS
jgi:uncharacterized protein (TIGR02147 family)